MIRFLAVVVLWCVAVPAWAGERVMAVLAFEAHTERPDLHPLGRGIGDMLMTDLSRPAEVTVVERGRLDAVLDELELGESRFVDDATAARVGDLTGATEVVVGAITVLGEGMRIDARVVDVQTGVTVLAVERSGRVDDFFALEKALAREILTGLAVEVEARTERQLAREVPEVAPEQPAFWDEVERSTVRRERIRPLYYGGLVTAAVGLLAIGGTYGLYASDPGFTPGSWRALQGANTAGWVLGAGGAVMTVLGLRGRKVQVTPVGVAGRF